MTDTLPSADEARNTAFVALAPHVEIVARLVSEAAKRGETLTLVPFSDLPSMRPAETYTLTRLLETKGYRVTRNPVSLWIRWGYPA